ncbi:MAG: hypothetical protein RLZZ241_2351 [Bacteroidota bacterium]|jgi:predicted deacylase
MKVIKVTFLGMLLHCGIAAQQPVSQVQEVQTITLNEQAPGTRQHYWLRVGSDMFGRSIAVPLIVLKGSKPGNVMGITAAIHGNELNGIPVIHQLLQEIDPQALKGSIIAVPGMNPIGMLNNNRTFFDGEDLNRVFPGKENGNEAQQLAHVLGNRLLEVLDFHLDLHTASFGRVNSLYARADLNDDTLAFMAKSLKPDIILNSKEASAGARTSGTFREMALTRNIKSITLEMGDPQVFNRELIDRGVSGIKNLLTAYGFISGTELPNGPQVICERSYWIYTQSGGILEVAVEVGQMLKKGEVIGVLKDPFGTIRDTYFAPSDGVVIGKSTNPTALSGARILHLGILQKTN